MKVIWRLAFWMNLSTRKTGVRNSHTTFAAIAQHSQYECIHWHQSGKCWRWGKHLLLFIKLRTWWPKTSNDHIMYIRKSPDARRQFRQRQLIPRAKGWFGLKLLPRAVHLDTCLTLRGTWGFYLSNVLPLRPKKKTAKSHSVVSP